MMLDRAAIERRVPHAGAMCLLDAVTAMGRGAHRLPRRGARALPIRWRATAIVPAVAASEYAAQATAVHGALLDGQAAPRDGVLAKLSDVELHSARIPFDAGPLAVRAELLGRGAAGCLYGFDVATERQPIASGRLMVAFTA